MPCYGPHTRYSLTPLHMHMCFNLLILCAFVLCYCSSQPAHSPSSHQQLCWRLPRTALQRSQQHDEPFLLHQAPPHAPRRDKEPPACPAPADTKHPRVHFSVGPGECPVLVTFTVCSRMGVGSISKAQYSCLCFWCICQLRQKHWYCSKSYHYCDESCL